LPYHLGLGMIIKNLVEPRIHFNKGLGTESLLPKLRVGVSSSCYDSKLNGYFEFSRVLYNGYAPEYSIGAEWRPVPVFALRAGYGDFNFKENGAVCFGAGLFVKGVFFDYAFNGRSDLGFSGGHRLGIGYRLNYGE